jgi:hypothetical protein
MSQIAYCRDCKVVIALGPLAPQRTVLVKGKRKTINTTPSHKVDGKPHENVGILTVPDEEIQTDPKKAAKLFDTLTKKYKAEFK